jgi:hypothetical protein
MLLTPCLTAFGSWLTISKSTSVFFPNQIRLGQTAVGDYTIKNNSTVSQNIYIQHFQQQGFQQVEAENASPISCKQQSGFSLSAGASCTLRLAYRSSVATTLPATNLPTACISPDNTGCAASNETTAFTVTADPTDSTTLNLDGTNISFTPGATTTVIVNNTGNIPANNAAIQLPKSLQMYLDDNKSTTSCPSIPANSSCNLSFAMLNGLPKNTLDPFTLSASDAPAILLTGSVTDSQLSVTGATITAPGTAGNQSIVLNNGGNKAVTGLSINLGSGLSGVTSTTSTKPCGSNLAAFTSCEYTYTASPIANGSATATITFTPTNSPQTSRKVTLAVANTTLAINPNASGEGQAIEGPESGSGSFIIKNTGTFATKNLTITKANGDTWLHLNASACPSDLAANTPCTVTYTVDNDSNISGVVSTYADNATKTNQNFLKDGTFQIGIDDDPAKQHLMYHAIKIMNNTSQTQTLNSIEASIPSSASNIYGHIALCDYTASKCLGAYVDSYKSTCFTSATAGATLQPGASCELWYKANSQSALLTDTSNDIPINITTSPTENHGYHAKTVNYSATITMTYGNDYYTPYAPLSNGSPISGAGLLKWDGHNNWDEFMLPESSHIFLSVMPFNGDLYANGNVAGNLLSRWNGSELITIPSQSNGTAFAGIVFNHKLIVAGQFPSVDSLDNTTDLAQYDPSQSSDKAWSAIGKGIDYNSTHNGDRIRALYTLNNQLYIGGNFSNAGGVAGTKNIAMWDPAAASGAGAWSALGSGANDEVNYFTLFNNNLIAAGNFYNTLTSSGTLVANTSHVAQWNLSENTWSGLGNGLLNTNAVGGLAVVDNTLYVATQPQSTIDNLLLNAWDASATSPAWQTVDTGIAQDGSIVDTLTNIDNQLVMAGLFSQVSASPVVPVNSFVSYDASASPAWSTLSQPNASTLLLSGAIAPSITLAVVSSSQH